MKPEEIRLGDWMRVLFGESPPAFFVELIIRTVFLFVLLLLSMRLLGPRMAGQISRLEKIALFSLAAAIGVPLQAPDRGLLPAMVIALVVVVVGRVVAAWAYKSPKAEAALQDEAASLVSNGIINIDRMKKTRISREKLFSQLRAEGLRHLGQVERLYFEAGGDFTVRLMEPCKPGLSILPEFDKDLISEQEFKDEEQLCARCGRKRTQQARNNEKCENCGEKIWVSAMI
ncbi:MAG TPA: YetF domain-containing protein [Flavisolibacter sp.]|nr:YetF domain-containing protein [Flavisolibacter sp.]